MIACFGDRCFPARLLAQTAGPNIDPSVTVSVAGSDLRSDPAELTALLSVYPEGTVGAPTVPGRTFTGYVRSMEPDGEAAWRFEASSMATWEERPSGGISVAAGTPIPEVIWMTGRSAGLPPESVQIHNWRPPLGRIHVVIPVEGVSPQGELQAGPVGMTMDARLAERFAGLGPPVLQAGFVESGFWASVTVEARTMYDAEQRAIAEVQRVISRLALAARYSLTQTPDGTIRPFSRKRLLERIRMTKIAGVERLDSPGKWLRGFSHDTVVEPLDARVLLGIEGDIGVGDERIDEAIAAWRRASAEEDPTTAVVALAEAIEFYVAGVKVERLFGDEQLDAIRSAASVGLAGEQLARVKDIVGLLNEPPFKTRLRQALSQDQVHHNPTEFRLLERFRTLRNKILHGQARVLPGDDELQQALALVNRLLLSRLHRLSGPT